ncbi:MAG: RNA polymerase sigma factor [Candidatus Nealsonbacteria bacterium]|nr:RNA polymerase sigma factor [Candidatus Nealsonbacteria bacterium]
MANQKKEFGKIYDKYIEKIYRFIFVRVSSEDIAQDICSETFLRGWESFKTQKIDNPQAFLYRIARNLVIDHYREKGRTKIISAEYASIPDPRAGFEEKIAFDSDLNQVKAALSKLSDDYQTVVVLRYLEDLPIAEIAKALDKTEDATRVTLHRALKALKNEVNRTA